MGTLLVILGVWTLIAIALAICVGHCIAKVGEFPAKKEPGNKDAWRLGMEPGGDDACKREHMEKTGLEGHA